MPVSKGSEPNRRKATASTPRRAPTRATSTTQAPSSPNPSANGFATGLIGARLRSRRLASGISLRQFARDLDVSASFISQLETGKAQPSVATLFAICAALDITTDELFDNETDFVQVEVADQQTGSTDAANNSWRVASSFGSSPTEPLSRDAQHPSSSPVVKPHERKVLVLDSGVTWESLTATRADKTDFMFVRYDVDGSSTLEGRLIRHIGTEYGFIISGTLEITLGFDTYRLSAGDSISFDSSRPHRLANVGDSPVEAVWMNIETLGRSH